MSQSTRTANSTRATIISAVPTTGRNLYLPVLEVTWPETMEALIMPTTSGSICRPEVVGVAPFTICRYCGIIIIAPNMPMPTISSTTLTRLNIPLWNSRTGISASSPTRRSTRTHSSRPTAATA